MTKIITGKEAFELLGSVGMYMIMDKNEAIVYGQPDEDGGKYGLDLGYTDGDGLEYEYRFNWESTDPIEVGENQIFLPETNGDITSIKLLEVKQL